MKDALIARLEAARVHAHAIDAVQWMNHGKPHMADVMALAAEAKEIQLNKIVRIEWVLKNRYGCYA